MNALSSRQMVFLASGSIALAVFFILLLTHQLFPNYFHRSLLLILPAAIFAALILFFFIGEKFICLRKTSKTAKTSPEADSQTEIETLKEAAQYRKEFLGNVSHELKTPIFNIQGYLHTLLDGGLDDPEVNRKYLLKASENLERLTNIVHDLEIISQIESNALTLDFTRLDIRDLIEEVINELSLKAELKGIHLKFSVGSDTAAFVRADRDSLRQVVTNLISNSIRYGKQDGETSVAVYQTQDKVTVEVADNGIGIAEEHLPRIFERFYRVDKSRSRELGGTGLGLSIVKHILEAHGQTIHVKSKPGEGSVFSFTLKRA